MRARLLGGLCVGIILFLYTDASGYSQEGSYQRIVSLGPSITKGLYLLGAEDRLIANTTYCISPSGAGEKEKIGTAVEVNIEKVFGLKPDLVLATGLTDPREKEKLKDLGIKVITFPTPRDFNQICRQFLELAKLVGKEKEAEAIVGGVKGRTASIAKRLIDLPRPKVLIQVGARPLFAATGSYFVNDYIELAGGVNIAKQAKEGAYSREEVLRANPDIIIITTMGMAGEKEKRAWEIYETLSAVKNGRIYIIDTDKVTSPTPVSFVETLEEIVRILHPEE